MLGLHYDCFKTFAGDTAVKRNATTLDIENIEDEVEFEEPVRKSPYFDWDLAYTLD